MREPGGRAGPRTQRLWEGRRHGCGCPLQCCPRGGAAVPGGGLGAAVGSSGGPSHSHQLALLWFPGAPGPCPDGLWPRGLCGTASCSWFRAKDAPGSALEAPPHLPRWGVAAGEALLALGTARPQQEPRHAACTHVSAQGPQGHPPAPSRPAVVLPALGSLRPSRGLGPLRPG